MRCLYSVRRLERRPHLLPLAARCKKLLAVSFFFSLANERSFQLLSTLFSLSYFFVCLTGQFLGGRYKWTSQLILVLLLQLRRGALCTFCVSDPSWARNTCLLWERSLFQSVSKGTANSNKMVSVFADAILRLAYVHSPESIGVSVSFLRCSQGDLSLEFCICSWHTVMRLRSESTSPLVGRTRESFLWTGCFHGFNHYF